MGKSFDQPAPCGPLHKVSAVGHILEGAISLSVNDQVKQTGDLKLMIWNDPEIIANLSTDYEPAPGDLIFTGTPVGVGPALPGDRIEGTIVGLGSLRIAIGPRED